MTTLYAALALLCLCLLCTIVFVAIVSAARATHRADQRQLARPHPRLFAPAGDPDKTWEEK